MEIGVGVQYAISLKNDVGVVVSMDGWMYSSPIWPIGAAYGFSDINAFYAAFKRYM